MSGTGAKKIQKLSGNSFKINANYGINFKFVFKTTVTFMNCLLI